MEQLTPEELARIEKMARETSQTLAKALQPLVKSIQLLQKQWVESFQNWVEPFQKLQQPFLQLMRTRAEIRRTAQVFQECNLWLTPSMVGLTDKIVKLYYEGKKQVIPSIISRYYKGNNWAILRETVSNWESNSFFQPRMEIIYDALEAHIEGKYTLSVPTLLPHIEGIAREIVEKYNLPKLEGPVIYRKRAYGKNGVKTWPSTVFAHVGISDLSVEEWVAVESLLYYLEGILYFSPGDFQKELERLKRQSKLNRQSILHGVQIKYATPMNSLRCFLALDVLSLLSDKDDKDT